MFSCFKIRYLFQVCSVSANRLHVALQIQPALMTSQVIETPSHACHGGLLHDIKLFKSNFTVSFWPEKLSYVPLTLYQWLTTSFSKNKTNDNLLIFCQTRLTYFRCKMATYERDRIQNICCQKSIFQLNPLSKQLFSCS